LSKNTEDDKITGMIKLFIMLIKLYQRSFGLLFINSCRFTPTCSEYAIAALKKHGLVRGSYLSLKRILKCNPYNKKSGRDPVP
jgi:uncharacterized protein